MAGLYNLKPQKVVNAFERAGWTNRGFIGSHIKLTKEGNANILSIPVHRGKPVKIGTNRELMARLENQPRPEALRSTKTACDNFSEMIRTVISTGSVDNLGAFL